VYQSLGLTVDDRVSAYRGLFGERLDSSLINEIRQASKGNYALGSERFKKEVEAALGRRASPGLPGRPGQRK
jgi:putative transposase